MMLGGPDVIEPAAVREFDFIERVLEQGMLGILGPGPGELMFVKPAKFHSYECTSRSLTVAVQTAPVLTDGLITQAGRLASPAGYGGEAVCQYFGTLGSILSLQARMPPFMFLTFLKPACFRKSTALALRVPLLQCATISVAVSSSFTRLGRSPSGISLDVGMLQIRYSCGSRTS